MAAAAAPPLPFPKLTNYPLLSSKPRGPRRRPPLILAAGPSIVFAGGGSGGHIFPAIAIADALRSAHPAASITFIGSPSGLERSAAPSAGYDFIPVPAARLTRPFLSPPNLLLPLHLLRSLAASRRILRRLDPQVVVGTGGFVSAAPCLAAALAGTTLVIQEQNAFPGITNRALGPYADAVFLAFNAARKHFPRGKCVVCGNPTRGELGNAVSKAEALAHFFPEALDGGEGAQTVLMLGGSMGANAINVAVLKICYELLAERANRYVVWQTGAEWFSEMKDLVDAHPRLLLAPFLHEMDMAYGAADIVVSRAGAMTCTEILNAGKPSILIPSPMAAEDHQTKNAYAMADIAGSKVITEDELDSGGLEIAISEVLGDADLMAKMSEKAMRAATPNAASEIAQTILSLV